MSCREERVLLVGPDYEAQDGGSPSASNDLQRESISGGSLRRTPFLAWLSLFSPLLVLGLVVMAMVNANARGIGQLARASSMALSVEADDGSYSSVYFDGSTSYLEVLALPRAPCVVHYHAPPSPAPFLPRCAQALNDETLASRCCTPDPGAHRVQGPGHLLVADVGLLLGC